MFLKGKKGLIMGVANDRSIAWGIAQALHKQGAELAFSYQGEVLKKRVEPLVGENIPASSSRLFECDVTNDDSVANLMENVAKSFGGKFDFIVHSIAFANKDELKGRFLETSRENFLMSMNISCYSFVSVIKKAEQYLNENASILCLTYYGAEKVIPNYNVMGVAKAALECSVKYLANDLGVKGIRVNAISSGPIRTLAAAGIGDFKSVLSFNEANAPLRRNVTLEDVGGTAVYLLSELGSGVTGENIHVDCGYSVTGMPAAITE
jgi:enoyl-[acyl-carrier protein] reductase I